MALLLLQVTLGERQVDVAPLGTGLGCDMRSLGSERRNDRGGGDCISGCHGDGGLRVRLLVLMEVWLGLS